MAARIKTLINYVHIQEDECSIILRHSSRKVNKEGNVPKIGESTNSCNAIKCVSENCTSDQMVNGVMATKHAERTGRFGKPESGRGAPLVQKQTKVRKNNGRLDLPSAHGIAIIIENIGEVIIDEIGLKVSRQATSKEYCIIKRVVVMYNPVQLHLRLTPVDNIAEVSILSSKDAFNGADGGSQVRKNCAPDPVAVCRVEYAVIMGQEGRELGPDVVEFGRCREGVARAGSQGEDVEVNKLEGKADSLEVAEEAGRESIVRSSRQNLMCSVGAAANTS